MDREHTQKIEGMCRAFLKGDLTVMKFARMFHEYLIDGIPYEQRSDAYARTERFHRDIHILASEQQGWRGKHGEVYAGQNREMRSLTGTFLEDFQQLVRIEAGP